MGWSNTLGGGGSSAKFVLVLCPLLHLCPHNIPRHPHLKGSALGPRTHAQWAQGARYPVGNRSNGQDLGANGRHGPGTQAQWPGTQAQMEPMGPGTGGTSTNLIRIFASDILDTNTNTGGGGGPRLNFV